ncbi:TPA: hypothetical protein DEO28_01590 [Candidatus Dependentiae bacterium]|nr:MAG: hypothetical protein UR14_C0004G0009 [candidate division TM6 bacterium GW2011_GWE2_31_21]KKP52927.1 MAG: hypothetical protein UR43_C0008G0009 [candidate division TM6 bacterium GW2011_GWF2_33_332]HBS47832.1 hypothetical protein [Candidatus Dependentiae bacterium]HBZ73192.1 hypothetical protein [Candidatus Dependentiae bacterium]
MDFISLLENLSIKILWIPTVFILIASIIITFKMRFIQIRTIPLMFKIFFSNFSKKSSNSKDQTIKANRALFTAMSTTIGISSITSPAIAIRLGGPGTLVGFAVATLLGGAVTFVEVTLAMAYRKKLENGTVMGGPMQYLKAVHPLFASWYAYAGFILLIVWSARQANTAATLLTIYKIPAIATGLILLFFVVITLIGGIKRIGSVAEKIVPIKFILYCSGALWIILCNLDKLKGVLSLIIHSAFVKDVAIGAAICGGMQYVIRWGMLQAFQNNEAGMGTAAIPHSMSDSKDPFTQGVLSIASIYAYGFVCMLSGLVILMTGTWKDINIGLGINMVSASFAMYFSTIGPLILSFSAAIFAYTTILGNCYNGSQCFSYITKNRYLKWYLAISGIFILVGTLCDVKLLWILTDFFVIPVAVPNVIGILILAFRRKDLFKD